MGNFKVYTASAGAGKTYALVLEFISLCLKGARHKRMHFSQILAITFTKKATAEMVTRVISGLGEIGAHGSSELREQIAVRIKLPENEVQERAKKTLETILHNFGLLQICTIDAFTTQLVKPFSHELQLPPDFEIVLNDTEIKEHIASEIIFKAGSDPKISFAIDSWIAARISTGEKITNISNTIVALTTQLLSSGNFHFLNLLEASLIKGDLKQVHQAAVARKKELENILIQKSEDLQSFLTKNGIEEDHIRGKSKSGIRVLPKWLEGNFFANHETIAKTISDDRGPFQEIIKDSFAHIERDFITGFETILSFIEVHYNEYICCQEVHNHFSFTTLASEIYSHFNAYCQRNNVMLLDQLNSKVQHLLTSNATPFVYERLGTRFKHILIDEFQDTSIIQWHNLLPLVSNSISELGQVIVVGDAKQAIYRWRNGEMEQIVHLPKIKPNPNPDLTREIESQLTTSFEPLPLKKNYRSGSEIVAFNNVFLKEVGSKTPEPYGTYYTAGDQTAAKDFSGLVELTFASDLEKNTDRVARETQEVEFCVSKVQQCLASGIVPQDIHIICRNKKQIAAYKEALTLSEIKCHSYEQNQFLEKDLPALIVAIMKCHLNQEPESNLVVALLKLNELSPDQWVFQDMWNQLLTVNAKKKVVFDPAKFRTFFKLSESASSEQSITLFCFNIMEHLGLDLNQPDFVQLIDITSNYESASGNWLNGFLHYLESNNESFISESSAENAVQLLTIHASKGLGLHTVIMPSLFWTANNNKDAVWVETPKEIGFADQAPAMLFKLTKKNCVQPPFSELLEIENTKELIDDFNLLYVAFTRAENNLILNAPPLLKTKGDPTGKALNLLSQWMEKAYNSDRTTPFVYSKGAICKSNNEGANVSEELLLTNDPSFRDVPLIFNVDNPETVRGIFLHDCFAKFPWAKDQNHWFTQIEVGANTDLLNPFWKQLNEWAQALNWDKSKDILIENEFIHEGELLRPDRVDIFDSHVLVSDLKTGAVNPSHQEQIKSYICAVENAFSLPCKGVLLYEEDGQILEVA